MQVTRVKICGITSVADARLVADAGADAIGLVFFPGSPRYVTAEVARQIVDAVGPFIQTVGLFVNAESGFVNQVIRDTGISLLQFHGDEDELFCSQFLRPYIKAIRMKEGVDPDTSAEQFSSASGYLFDAYNPEKYGGTGESFDWSRLPKNADYPVILAGGLTPSNIRDAICAVRPYAVDVSGGVESSPGVKSPELVRKFMSKAKSGVWS